MVFVRGERWSVLPAEHRRWILLNALLVTAITNLGLNAAIAWLSVRGHAAVPVWGLPAPGETNVVTDTVGTFFFLPFFTCATCTTAVWAQVRSGRLQRLGTVAVPRRLAHGRFRRGVVLGVATAVLLSPLAGAAFAVWRLRSVSATQFIVYKAVLGVLLGAVVTPLIALFAMADGGDLRVLDEPVATERTAP